MVKQLLSELQPEERLETMKQVRATAERLSSEQVVRIESIIAGGNYTTIVPLE